jgi:hypothetical protein
VADSRSFFILPLWSPVNQRSIGARFPAARITCLPASRIWVLIFLWGVRDTALELLGVRLAQVPPLHNRLAESYGAGGFLRFEVHSFPELRNKSARGTLSMFIRFNRVRDEDECYADPHPDPDHNLRLCCCDPDLAVLRRRGQTHHRGLLTMGWLVDAANRANCL